MLNFDGIIESAGAQGITIKKFCSMCSNEATGELTVPISETETFPMPICESCVAKFDTQSSDVLD